MARATFSGVRPPARITGWPSIVPVFPKSQEPTANSRTHSPILVIVPERHVLVVPPELAGTRLDRVLRELLANHSRSSLARLIAEGQVRVDTRPALKSSLRVEADQTIEIVIPDVRPTEIVAQDLPLEVLYQDADIVVINKPPGLVIHPSAGHDDETLVNALLHHVSDLSGIGGELRPGIVHRLDKDTSGVLIVAKHDVAHRALTSAWNTPAVRKEYLALVYGTPALTSGTIEAPIGRDPRDRKKMAVVTGGRNATTEYVIVERFRYLSLLRLTLRTGRTHQIRVHLKHLGHPIVGDPAYSGPQWKGIPDKKLQKVLAGAGRQMLHAARLTFVHPVSGRELAIEADVPEDMAAVIEAVR